MTRSSDQKEFSVVLCAFTPSEEKVLSSAFKLSTVRSRRYAAWEGDEAPEIAIVNEDRPEGLEALRALQRRFASGTWPVLRVGAAERETESYAGISQIFYKRPVLASRILKTLDQLVAEAYQFNPEAKISDDATVDTLADLVRQAKGPAPEAAADAKKILVIDDSEAIRKMMEVKLQDQGHQVEFAVTGEDGLTRAQAQEFQLIFLDVMLPGINGYEVCRRLKREIRVRCPVILLTSKSSRIDKLRGSLASADHYLTKPLEIADLQAALERFL